MFQLFSVFYPLRNLLPKNQPILININNKYAKFCCMLLLNQGEGTKALSDTLTLRQPKFSRFLDNKNLKNFLFKNKTKHTQMPWQTLLNMMPIWISHSIFTFCSKLIDVRMIAWYV